MYIKEIGTISKKSLLKCNKNQLKRQNCWTLMVKKSSPTNSPTFNVVDLLHFLSIHKRKIPENA